MAPTPRPTPRMLQVSRCAFGVALRVRCDSIFLTVFFFVGRCVYVAQLINDQPRCVCLSSSSRAIRAPLRLVSSAHHDGITQCDTVDAIFQYILPVRSSVFGRIDDQLLLLLQVFVLFVGLRRLSRRLHR
jgi:hypothetical protein